MEKWVYVYGFFVTFLYVLWLLGLATFTGKNVFLKIYTAWLLAIIWPVYLGARIIKKLLD